MSDEYEREQKKARPLRRASRHVPTELTIKEAIEEAFAELALAKRHVFKPDLLTSPSVPENIGRMHVQIFRLAPQPQRRGYLLSERCDNAVEILDDVVVTLENFEAQGGDITVYQELKRKSRTLRLELELAITEAVHGVNALRDRGE